jgi:hypothetical protein
VGERVPLQRARYLDSSAELTGDVLDDAVVGRCRGSQDRKRRWRQFVLLIRSAAPPSGASRPMPVGCRHVRSTSRGPHQSSRARRETRCLQEPCQSRSWPGRMGATAGSRLDRRDCKPRPWRRGPKRRVTPGGGATTGASRAGAASGSRQSAGRPLVSRVGTPPPTAHMRLRSKASP